MKQKKEFLITVRIGAKERQNLIRMCPKNLSHSIREAISLYTISRESKKM